MDKSKADSKDFDVELVPAGIEDKAIIENLFHYYVYEMSDFLGLAPSDKGIFTYSAAKLNKYWEQDDHYPFLIRCMGEIAGFSLLRKYPADSALYDIGQFFILRKYKGMGVGRRAFELSVSTFPGQWLTRVLLENKPALAFWLSVIGQVTDNHFFRAIETDEDLPMHFIRYDIAK
ncbi:GNAT family N-acetyltransferase [Spongorhabdus nitratireducens]